MSMYEKIINFYSRLKFGKAAPVKPDPLNLDFKQNSDITIGVEVELQIINQHDLELTDRADEMLAALNVHSKQFVPELFKSVIEINSTVHNNVNDLETELRSLMTLARDEAHKQGCYVIGGGCHPYMHYANLETRDQNRYGMLLDRNQWLMRRWMVSGMHIHLGMSSGHECIRFMHFFEHFVPHLLALSSSSPYWQGSDTGLQSCRSIISEALPTAALIYTIESWPEFTDLVGRLSKSKAITSLKDLHWDIRPSPGYGTVEIRIMDMPTNLQDVLAFSAFVHALAVWFSSHGDWLSHMPKPPMWLARENKWRALRYGLEAEIIQNIDGDTVPLKEDFTKIFERIEKTVKKYAYSQHIEHLHQIILNGNSSDRQRQVYAANKDLQNVVRHNLMEFEQGRPIQPENALSSADFSTQTA